MILISTCFLFLAANAESNLVKIFKNVSSLFLDPTCQTKGALLILCYFSLQKIDTQFSYFQEAWKISLASKATDFCHSLKNTEQHYKKINHQKFKVPFTYQSHGDQFLGFTLQTGETKYRVLTANDLKSGFQRTHWFSETKVFFLWEKES